MADGLILYDAEALVDLDRLLTEADARMRRAVAEVLHEQMLEVMAEAKDLCPYLTGALAGSGRVSEPYVTDRGVSIELDFGREPYIWYASDQHENPTYRHASGKSYKFLEKPLLEWSLHGPAEVVAEAALRL